jgi:hypothetical protein
MCDGKLVTGLVCLTIPWLVGCQSSGKKAFPPKEMFDLPLIFDETFDSADGDFWAPTDPEAWRVVEDEGRSVYSLFKPSKYRAKHRSPYGIAWRKDVYVSDFVMDVWLRSTKENYGHRDLCLFFGGQTPLRYYYVHFGLEADPHSHTIMIVNDAPRTSIVETRTGGTPWEDRYHHARIIREVETGKIDVFFDDMARPVMTAADCTLKWGRIGIGSFDDIGNFDRVILWGETVTPPVGW